MRRLTPSLPERAAAAAALTVCAPVLALAAAAIRLDDGGSALFSQTRVGLSRTHFRVWKLRTMANGEVTRVGAVLRKAKLDELPQLWNIVRGEMRLVGPRPITPGDVSRLGWEQTDADARWAVAPGITGPTQLSAVCDAERALRRDTRFARDATRRDEAEILVLSLVGAVVGRRIIATRVERWS